MNIIKEAQKQEPLYSSRMNPGTGQFRNFQQDSPDNQLLQSFLRNSMQRGSAGTESNAGMPNNNPSTAQESSFNYIFNMLLSSVSNQDDAGLPNVDSFMNLNQSFGNQGGNS